MATKIKLGNGNWGVKDGGTLAYNDENGVFKAVELSSSRASSGTYVAESGLIADAESGVPRIDWTNGVGELLLEPQSTNLVTYSEDFSNAFWSKSGGSSVTINDAIAPDGTNTATTLTRGTADLSLRRTGTVVATNTYTFSIWAKSDSVNQISIDISDETNVVCNLTSEWQRFSVTTTSALNNYFDVAFVGGNSGDSVKIWGAQLEALSYATSYIRTSGTTATRIADAVTGNSSLGQVINSSEGVLYAEVAALADDSSIKTIELNDGATNRVFIYFRDSTLRCFVIVNGTTIFSHNETISDVTTLHKCALKWKENDFAFYVDGVKVDSQSSGIIFPNNTLDNLSFNAVYSTLPFYGRIRELKVYDTALTDAELLSLTSL